MTIKELESRTGMTRANIRFYEGEGLLNPKRLDNGYRDYSEDDAQTLEKIKLLRQLQLDLDTIRKVQQGSLTLEQALFSQLTRLEGDKAVLERAAEVCRTLEQSGVEYSALDPQPWLQQLDELPAPKREALPPQSVIQPERDDTPRACWHPWQRYFARMLDLNLYSAVFNVLWLVLLRDQTVILSNGIFGWFLYLLLLMFTLLAAEPLWLHYWGWTPGKWVFGLKLRDEHGQKLTLSQGFERGCNVLLAGYGLNVPIFNLWRFWRCRKLGLEGRDCSWDGENDYRYTKEDRWFYGLIFAVAIALCTAAIVIGILYTQTPLHQGGLTVEQFSENYNYYFKQLVEQDITGLPSLGSDGRWVERYLPDDGIYLFRGTTVWSDPVFTLDGDQVSAVELRMETEDSIVMSSGTREQLALLAMTGALDGLNLFNYDINGWVRAYEDQASQWQNVEFTYRGLRVSQQVEYSGYSNTGSHLWQKDEDTPCHCEMTLTISLAE